MIRRLEFYAWFEKWREFDRIVNGTYKCNLSATQEAELRSDLGLTHPTPGLKMPDLLSLTLMKAHPVGFYLGETWSNIQDEEAWQKVFEFQRRCLRTCVYVAGVGLPPENVDEFLRRAAESREGIL